MTSDKTNTTIRNRKRLSLEKRREALLEEVEAASNQLSFTLSDVDSIRIKRLIKTRENEISEIEKEINQLSTEQQVISNGIKEEKTIQKEHVQQPIPSINAEIDQSVSTVFPNKSSESSRVNNVLHEQGEKGIRIIHNISIPTAPPQNELVDKKKIIELILSIVITATLTTLFALVNRTIKETFSPSIPNYAIDVIFVVFLLFVLLVAWVVIWHFQKKKKLIFIPIGIVLIFAIWLFVTPLFLDQRSVYIVLDASENMKGSINFEEVRSRIDLKTSIEKQTNVNFGFIVFGSSIDGKVGCDDITELVKLSPSEASIPEITSAVEKLTNIESTGPGNLQKAIEFVITKLAHRRGLQQIFVLTSKTDQRCADYDKEKLDNIANSMGVKYELIIIPLGYISEKDKLVYDKFSHSIILDQRPEDISKILDTVITTDPSPYSPYYKSTSQ